MHADLGQNNNHKNASDGYGNQILLIIFYYY